MNMRQNFIGQFPPQTNFPPHIPNMHISGPIFEPRKSNSINPYFQGYINYVLIWLQITL